MSALIRLLDYVFVLRPIILIPAWSFFLLGVGSVPGGLAMPWLGPTLIAVTCILISGYLLNQVFDRESDEKNNKCPHLTHGIFTPRTLVVLAVVFFIGASFMSQRVGGTSRLLLVGALALSLFYSLPPIRLCSRPFLDMLANAVGYGGGTFVLGYLAYGGNFDDGVIMGWPYVLLVASTFLFTTILDLDGDRAAHKLSTTVFIGVRASFVLAALMHIAAVVWSVLLGNVLMIAVNGASLPITLYACWRRTDGAAKTAVQGNTLIVTLGAIYVWPYYAAIFIPLVIASRFYYRKRFGLTYPGPAKSAEPTA